MKKLLLFFTFIVFFSINSLFSIIFTPPANPTAPPFINSTDLPFVIINNSGLPDSEVYITITGRQVGCSDPTDTNCAGVSYVVINTTTGQASLILADPNVPEASENYSYALSDLPLSNTTPSGRVVYFPYINSGVFFISTGSPLSIPAAATGAVTQPNFLSPNDPNYNIIFDTFEFAYLSTPTQVTINATAVNFFSLPLYSYLSTNDPNTLSNLGLYQPRSFIMAYARNVFNNLPASSVWNNLFLSSNDEILRLLSPGKAMSANIFDPNYLDNEEAYGFSFIDYIWSSPTSYYRTNTNPLVMTIPAGSFETYTGVIQSDNTIKFTSSPSNYTVIFGAPTRTTSSSSFPTSLNIFAGISLATSDTSGQDDGVQLSKLFEESIIAGLVPTPNPLSNSYLASNQSSFYTVNPNLPTRGQTTGYWYDSYSKALHSLGNIYTYAYDEPLWPQVQLTSQFYQPNATYGSITIGLVSNIPVTTTVLTSSQNPAPQGTNVTFTATVSGGNGSPTGTVTFLVDNVAVSTQPLTGGTAVYSTPGLALGNHEILAVYSGDPNNAASISNTVTQTITPSSPIPSTNSIYASLNPAQEGQTVRFISVVEGPLGLITPTGTVVFTIDGVPGSPINLVDGRALFSTSSLAIGVHSVQASYSGDTHYLGSVSPIHFEIIVTNNRGPTTTEISSSFNPSQLAEAVTFTAVVDGAFGTATGRVAFFVDGVRNLVDLEGGVANFTISTLGLGNHQVIARYQGDRFNRPSVSNLVIQSVIPSSREATSTRLTSSPNPSTFGSPIVFTVSVTGTQTIPTGRVNFIIDGMPYPGIDLVDGAATFTIADLTVGQHQVQVVYQGDRTHQPSLSNTLVQVVGQSSSLIFPPADLRVRQVKNRFATQTDIINVLTWRAPEEGSRPAFYKIYRSSRLGHSIATIPGDEFADPNRIFSFKDHNRKKGRTYRYFIVSVDNNDNASLPAEVVFHPRS